MTGARAGLAVAALTVLVLAASAATASAVERAWQPPQLVHEGSPNDLHVVRTSLGETVTVYLDQTDFPIRMFARVKRADGTLEPAVELASELAGCVLDLATDARGWTIASWMTPNGTIKIARRPPGGVFLPPEVVRGSNNTGGSNGKLAMNPRGDAALFWALYDGDGHYVYQAAISRAGGSFGPVETLTPAMPIGTGGYDVALTPAGELVAVFATNEETEQPQPPVEVGLPTPPPERTSHATVHAVTRPVAGGATPIQKLSEFAGWATCPQVLSDGNGRVAAIWHEIDNSQCAAFGRDLVALRRVGTSFEPAAEVPGSRGQASPGELAVSDGGQIAIGYSTGDGQLVTGSFETPLSVRHSFGNYYGAPALAGGANGEVVFGPAEGPVDTGRLKTDGSIAPAQALRPDCENVRYVRLDVNEQGEAAAVMMRDGGIVELVTDAPAPTAGLRACRMSSGGGGSGDGGGGSGPPPGSPPASGAPPSSDQSADGFGVGLSSAKVSGRGRSRTATARITCGQPCRLTVTGVLGDRKGRWPARARVKAGGSGEVRVKLRFKLSKRGASAIGKRYRLGLHVAASDGAGKRVLRTFTVAR
jgi:hypothetical protein